MLTLWPNTSEPTSGRAEEFCIANACVVAWPALITDNSMDALKCRLASEAVVTRPGSGKGRVGCTIAGTDSRALGAAGVIQAALNANCRCTRKLQLPSTYASCSGGAKNCEVRNMKRSHAVTDKNRTSEALHPLILAFCAPSMQGLYC